VSQSRSPSPPHSPSPPSLAPADSLRERLAELAGNLRWTWSGEFDPLFREIDLDLWRRVNHNPTAFLAEVEAARLERPAADAAYRERLEAACATLRAYLASRRHWASRNAPVLAQRTVAYFSAEFGLHESLPIYSGGLGILAGDHLKSSSDLGLPIWGVSLLYRQGYFSQRIDADGRQQEEYSELDLARVPLEPVLDSRGQRLTLHITTPYGPLPVHLWRARVGRAHLLLLDGAAGAPAAPGVPATGGGGHLSGMRLYGGDMRTRLLHEILLGVGGYRALLSLGLRPGVLHLNEGHSAFAVLEAVAQTMEEEGLHFESAAERVRARTVFTTHTPVAAGHDRFPPDLVEEFLAPLRERLGLAREAFLGLGRVHPADAGEPFCMTVLAFRLAGRANAVSALHARTTRLMWRGLWSGPSAPILAGVGHVTNGVHVPSWVANEMARFLSRALGERWQERQCRADRWERIRDTPAADLWHVKRTLKHRLLEFVERRRRLRRERLGAEARRADVGQESGGQTASASAGRAAAGGDAGRGAGGQGGGGRRAGAAGSVEAPLDPAALTIGVARRFVEYKRAHMLFADPERLARLLGRPDRPVQILFAGKAHPQDEHGKAILRAVHEHSLDPRFAGRIVLLEDHDMNMARHLVQGCDLWLAMPRRPLEASGTSGQKAVFNATLNLSTLDGWWAEAYDGTNGFAFGEGLTHTDSALQDRRDALDLYDVLEEQVIPEFFERDEEGVPPRWVERIHRAFETLACRYNSDRMVIDYVTRCYLDAAGATTSGGPYPA
jgi:starch phosphorylase